VPVSWLVVVRWCIGRQHKRLASRRRPKACVCRVAGWSEDKSSACCPNQTVEARKGFRLGFGSRRGRRPWNLCSELGGDSTGHGRSRRRPKACLCRPGWQAVGRQELCVLPKLDRGSSEGFSTWLWKQPWPQAIGLVLGAWKRFDGPRAPCSTSTAANVW